MGAMILRCTRIRDRREVSPNKFEATRRRRGRTQHENARENVEVVVIHPDVRIFFFLSFAIRRGAVPIRAW